MENEIPVKTSNQLLIQQINEAALLTNASFVITACNAAAAELFHFNQHDLPGLDISSLLSTSTATSGQVLNIKSASFTCGIATCINIAGKKTALHITRHAIVPTAADGGYLFIYKPVAEDHLPIQSSTTKNTDLQNDLAAVLTTAQLRELSDHLLNIRETERKNIAREIHDELGQQLTILKMDVSWLHQKLQQYEDEALLQKTAYTLQLLNETIKTVRRIASELRPSMLDDLGIIEAIEWQSKEFEKRSGIRIIFTSDIAHLQVNNSIATSLFRIYQEALTNIARHAEAKHVFSSMQLENDRLTLTIKDDGKGFDMNTLGVKKTLGLLGMKERTLMMGGRFEINSKTGEGTTIVVTTSLQSDGPARSQTGQ